MLPQGFEPAIPASEWPHNYALENAATGIGQKFLQVIKTGTNKRKLSLVN